MESMTSQETDPLSVLMDAVYRATLVYRKGEAVETRGRVMHVYAYPPAPSRGVLVDVHFILVGFTEAVGDAKGLRDTLDAALSSPGPLGGVVSAARMAEGPSYIELGVWLGSQEMALRLIALGEHLGWWKAITPGTLGVTGALADELAGAGMVMPSGLRDPAGR